MVTLLLDSTRLEVALSGAERMMAFRKENVTIDRSTIAKVQLIDDAWMWLRGVPNPGTHLRGVVAMGTWTSATTEDFVAVRGHRAGVVIDLVGHDDFQRVILSTKHGLSLVQALRLDVDAEALDVVEIATEPNRTKKSRARKAPIPAPAT